MEKNVPTIMKSYIQSAMLMGKPFVKKPYSTINDKLHIQEGATLNAGEYPTMKVVVIGNGGLKVATGADGLGYMVSYVHKPTDTALFRELPFLAVPVNADIGDVTRANYRLRKIVTGFDGNQYIAYYGKIIDVATPSTTIEERIVQPDGTVGGGPRDPQPGDLTPVPTILSSGSSVTTTGTYISSSTKVDFILNATDVTNILNASQIMFGDQNHGIISEIALCAGIDRNVISGSVPYTESLATTVISFLSTNFPTPDISQGIKYTFDIGNSEPILSVA